MNGNGTAVTDLKAALAAFAGNVDLDSAQRVEDYDQPENQQAYVHMYTAKYMGLWCALRRTVQWEALAEARLYSIGAGPNLCLLGWCWDTRWSGPKHAVDPLLWDAILQHPNWKSALGTVCGPIKDHRPVYVPGPTRPSQLSGMAGLKYLPPERLREGSVVLMPFVLNHLLHSGSLPRKRAAEMATWIDSAVQRQCRILIADLNTDQLDLWSILSSALGITPPAAGNVVTFNSDAARLGCVYDKKDANRRSGVTFPQFCQARVLQVEPSGSSFLAGAL